MASTTVLDTDNVIRARQNRLLYRQGPSGTWGNIIAAAIVAGALAWPTGRLWLLLPFALVISSFAARLVLIRRFEKAAPSEAAMPPWERRFFSSSLLGGLSWALAWIAIFPFLTTGMRYFAVALICGLVAAGIATLGAVLRVYLVYMVPILLSSIVASLLWVAEGRIALALLLTTYLAVMLRTARFQQGSITRAIRLAVEKEALLEELKESHAREQARAKEIMEIAERVQTSTLPELRPMGCLRIAAKMLPAERVGGDYYDLLPVDEQSCWIAIGDVSGHGLSAGLMMLMVQSAIATATSRDPRAGADAILALVNGVTHTNVRTRWKRSQHMTLTLLHHAGAGRFRFAGAHEEILVYRVAEDRIETIDTTGTWIGAIPDISRVTTEQKLQLGVGDRMVLFSDGLTEALAEGSSERFGMERLQAAIAKTAADDPTTTVSRILEEVVAFTPLREDDQTLMVIDRVAAAN